MDLHERYMRSTMDFSVFELSETAFKDDPLLLLHRIVKYYNNEIMKDNFDTKKLETFRIVLCYEYQLLFNSKEKNIKVTASDLCFKTIESILFLKKHSQNFTEHPILYDIIILQLILYCNLQCIEEHLMNFQKSNVDVLNNDESKFFYIKILECFLESLQLRHLLYNNADLSILKHFSLLYLKDIITWLEMKENKEWQLFTSIFPKLISTCSSENILPIIWNVILNKLDDFKDLLSALSIIVNVCFSSNFINDVIHTHYKLFYTEQLWLLIIKSLKSPIQQYRKQGLFIMKHITNFMNITNENVLKLKIPSIVPFVCGQKTETKILIKDIKQKFFLILDALEEKQHHLILPALTNLSTLIKGNEEHTLCNDCFNTIWLQLIFERILQHENNNIVKQGVLFVCKLYTFINDNQFLKLFVHVLNNTFLYECQSYQDEPDILSSIIILFIHVTEEETEFPKRLLKIMSEETWAPIPIFYVIKVLRTVTSKTLNQWGDDELILVKSLVQKNLNMHSHILRIASQVELIKIICFSIEKVNNLEIVIETLLEFSLEDTLVRESFSWEIVVNWLKEVLIKKHAIDFIKFICEQFSSQDSHVKLSPAKFAVVIAMFYDTGLILQHKTCVVFGILNNWLSILNGINTRPYFLDQLLEESNNVPKLKQILLNEMESLNTCYLKNLQEPLVSCCLHGHVLRRDKQIENQAYLYVTQNYRNYYPRHISIIDYNNDTSVRALSIILLYKIINADKEYASMLLPIVLQKLEKFRNKRYFNHSYIHKIKHRIMQILLILQPILNKLDIVILEDCLCNLMLLESNQHSIRLMQEWILIKIFVENIELHYKLWKFFEEGITTRPGCVSSIACIVYHVSRLLPSDSQCDFILMGIKYIAHCCLGQQYSMRLYNQIIFVKLYKMLEQFNCNDTIVQYKGLYDAAIASLKYGNLAINSSKIQDDFYFSVFHAVHDFSLQTIYFELPRLTDMDPSEWITPDLFQILNFKETINHPLQLYNLNTLLSDTKTSSYLMKSTVDKESSVKNSMMDIEELNNIQKKIDPLMPTNISHNDIFSTIRESVSHKRLSDEDGLIVVACLVNRAPNLGGLARTCEIFNVKELVIANLNQIKDKEFQNLSVSAENWITITEVKPHQLCKFLLDKKEMGWSLVGLEQTVNSVNLINMKFKKKTILVLGNEKDGIPANLISLFDTCIEIPQAGIIRSLNVHVSGAICIWQYSKQHVLI
nr:uncharacterized protein LOC117611961 isoform X2 [Osmia lignaria]